MGNYIVHITIGAETQCIAIEGPELSTVDFTEIILAVVKEKKHRIELRICIENDYEVGGCGDFSWGGGGGVVECPPLYDETL